MNLFLLINVKMSSIVGIRSSVQRTVGDDEGDMLEWPSLEGPTDGSFLLLFNKIHCRAVSVEKDTYLTPAHTLKVCRSSHSAQYCRYQTYSNALKNLFFPLNYFTLQGTKIPLLRSQLRVKSRKDE